MAPPKNNKFWMARSSHGRKPIFEDPEKLWESCIEYFDWVDENPLFSADPVKFQGKATLTYIPKMRAMTIQGLCTFLGISMSAWQQYRERDNFIAVCREAERIIYQQKFEGAAAEFLNPSIIARDLGLVEKKEMDVGDKLENVLKSIHKRRKE